MFGIPKPEDNPTVDINLLLANERTLLSWIRTSLALIAGGVAVGFVFSNPLHSTFAGLGAIGLGGMLSVIGYVRFLRTDRAIREGKVPETDLSSLVVMFIVLMFAATLIVLYRLI